jgi:myo-inositol-1-phosphate synthase
MHTGRNAGSVRIGIVGVGNCASSLVQGITHYRQAPANARSPGLMTTEIGGYRAADIEIAAAFDISARKVGRDVAEAILAPPNNTLQFAKVARTGVIVRRGPTLDGLGRYLRGDVEEADWSACDVAAALRESRTDVVVSYLPVGAQRASEFYAEQALAAGCGYVNCMPVFLASSPGWRSRFEERRLPIVGDDVKSQVGATIVHRILAALMVERGVSVDRTYQLNFGGNADFKNMLERDRLESKKISKTRAVQSQLDVPLSADDIHIGPSDYVPWLTDRKMALIRLEGTAFGGAPLSMEVKLEVWDSPNSAGVVIDAVRCAKLAMDRRVGGALEGPSAWLMKSPPVQMSDRDAGTAMQAFIAEAA